MLEYLLNSNEYISD
uniref:Uncharacterized protein n=1 Tax=Lepeophtheirus salmonis TaxID=72036 RepID=A0A0K2TP47_LEPSM